MKNQLNYNEELDIQYSRPEAILLWAFDFSKEDEIDLEYFISIALACVNPTPAILHNQDLINRMSQNVQWILHSLVSDWTLASRNDNGRILFRKIVKIVQ